MKRLAVCLFAAFASSPAFAGEPDLTSPAATVRSYLAATKANDVETAKKCWVIDDGNVSGTLDVVVGMWIESRRLVAATDAKLGPTAEAPGPLEPAELHRPGDRSDPGTGGRRPSCGPARRRPG